MSAMQSGQGAESGVTPVRHRSAGTGVDHELPLVIPQLGCVELDRVNARQPRRLPCEASDELVQPGG